MNWFRWLTYGLLIATVYMLTVLVALVFCSSDLDCCAFGQISPYSSVLTLCCLLGDRTVNCSNTMEKESGQVIQQAIRYANITATQQMRYPKILPGLQPALNEQKIILTWTTMLGAYNYQFGLGHKSFRRCPVTNCLLTHDKRLLHRASALLFHTRDYKGKMEKLTLPAMRFTNQSYVFYLGESPMLSDVTGIDLEGVFNLTITYRKDSDIPIPYGILNKGSSAQPDQKVMQIIAGKMKLVAWFVSHCNTRSERELYVQELQKHIPVDVYGACGPFKCPGRFSFSCYSMLERDYKFYLSFENSVCKDYITEKTYLTLNFYVIPIVLGGGNYTKDTPPHSVINARDFISPKHLADFLLELVQDEARYRSYFDWKKHYRKFRPYGLNRRAAICKLCELINTPGYSHEAHWDLKQWWYKEGACNENITDQLLANFTLS